MYINIYPSNVFFLLILRLRVDRHMSKLNPHPLAAVKIKRVLRANNLLPVLPVLNKKIHVFVNTLQYIRKCYEDLWTFSTSALQVLPFCQQNFEMHSNEFILFYWLKWVFFPRIHCLENFENFLLHWNIPWQVKENYTG